jgi:tRNA G10  N-methylase Trm11
MEFIFKIGFAGELAVKELESFLDKPVVMNDHNEIVVDFVDHKAMTEVADRLGGIIEVRDKISGNTVWRHKAKYWIRVDRSKPFAIAKKGLLPPKVARMMVNIASQGQTEGKVLWDPFCGSGTVLMEANEMGLSVIGSDIDKEQLAGCEKNLRWARIKPIKLALWDAAHISELKLQPVDMIVTEPFMGKTRYDSREIPNIYKGLTKLYKGVLKEWLKVLKPGGVIMMSFPEFRLNNKVYKTSDVIDQSGSLGYNVQIGGLPYSRPEAGVTREMILLRKIS